MDTAAYPDINDAAHAEPAPKKAPRKPRPSEIAAKKAKKVTKPPAKKAKQARKLPKTKKRPKVVKKAKRKPAEAKKPAASVVRGQRLDLRLSKAEKAKFLNYAKKARRTLTSIFVEFIEKLK